MTNINETLSSLSGAKSYDWLKLAHIWRKFTCSSFARTRKTGPAIVLSLHREVQEAVLGLENDTISRRDDVDKIIGRLPKIYEKDKLTQQYNALEFFKKYRDRLTPPTVIF